MTTTKEKLSKTYGQLSNLFKLLENADFQEGKDFGENVIGCFKWFISPPAVIFLEMRYPFELKELKANKRFSWQSSKWQDSKSEGADISLLFQ